MNAQTTRLVAIGDRLTDYSTIDVEVHKLASGGFGVVYLGPDRLLGEKWTALKTLRPDVLARSQRAFDLFVREGLIWVGLWPHANLLNAQSAILINSQPFLALAYAEHGSLRDLFNQLRQQRTWLAPEIALRLAQHIAAGLVALHTPDPAFLRPLPIVHRDLKPENVLVDEQGYAMITDFGLAKVAEAVGKENPALLTGVTHRLPLATNDTEGALQDTFSDSAQFVKDGTHSQVYQTAHGVALGTPAYMAPEQWEDAGSAGSPADVYAFGIILCELVTGRHPLLELKTAHTQDEWRKAHRDGQPHPLARLAAGGDLAPDSEQLALLAEVEGLYQACLAKRVEARPTTAAMLARLQQVAQRLGQAPYSPPEVYPHTPEHEMILWHNWATTYAVFGLDAEALARNERALMLAPANPYVLMTRGGLLAKLGRREEALTVYAQALTALPPEDAQGRAEILTNQGGRLYELGRCAEAETAYAQALTLKPDAANVWHNRAINQVAWSQTVSRAGHTEASLTHMRTALEYAERAAALNPHDPNYHGLRDELGDGLRTIERLRRLGFK